MTGNQRRSNTETATHDLSVCIVRNRDDPSHRLAFGDTATAEAFVVHAIDPAAWVVEPADALIDASKEMR